ncbi:hypothetical protein GCM10023094_00430 [Rhodococcus olei]|uniref:3-deoxy-D-arabino-heptulosonate 7-phosphate synthase n=1 Tax=Rhodococcus olei TaxID=2161675 RepID=A0ABP8NQQ5_9NOCA
MAIALGAADGHGSSQRNDLRRVDVVAEVAARIAGGERGVVGMMLESFIEAGRRDLALGKADELTCGQSIADVCGGGGATGARLDGFAAAVTDARRGPRPGVE